MRLMEERFYFKWFESDKKKAETYKEEKLVSFESFKMNETWDEVLNDQNEQMFDHSICIHMV